MQRSADQLHRHVTGRAFDAPHGAQHLALAGRFQVAVKLFINGHPASDASYADCGFNFTSNVPLAWVVMIVPFWVLLKICELVCAYANETKPSPKPRPKQSHIIAMTLAPPGNLFFILASRCFIDITLSEVKIAMNRRRVL